MSVTWPTKKLGELADICRGSSPRPICDTKYFDGGTVPWVKIADATKSGKFLYKTKEHVNDYGASFSRRLPPGTILVAASGTLGYTQILGVEGCAHDGWLILQKLRELDRDFAYYALKTLEQHFFNSGSGAAIQNINTDILREAEIPYPPLPVQRRIAGILSAYDELIENSQRRIRLLDDMARALYREWFVHFRFPGHDSVPRLPSALGDIPQGWEVTILDKVTTKIGSGATPRGGKGAYKSEGISLIRSMNIYDYEFEVADLAFIDDEQAAQLDNVTVQACDVLLNITGASVCRCSMVPSHLLPARVNQHVAIVRADTRRMDPFYLLDTINNDHNKQKLLNLAQGGATREALTKETICNFPILLPPRELLIRYGHVAGAMHAQRETLALRIETLRRTRDLLLPRLLSGQVELILSKNDS